MGYSSSSDTVRRLKSQVKLFVVVWCSYWWGTGSALHCSTTLPLGCISLTAPGISDADVGEACLPIFCLNLSSMLPVEPKQGVSTMVLKLSFACWDYDRIKAIEDGRVRVEGIDLNFLNYRVEET